MQCSFGRSNASLKEQSPKLLHICFEGALLLPKRNNDPSNKNKKAPTKGAILFNIAVIKFALIISIWWP